MKIAILKEKKNDGRVFLIPEDVKKLINNKYEVFVVKNAGIKAGYSDNEYISVGAKLVGAKTAITKSDFILKLTPINAKELCFIKQRQVLISLFNVTSHPKLLKILLKKNITTLGIEAITDNAHYPFLIPNEEIKGRFGANLAIYHLAKLDKNHLGKTFGTLNNNELATQVLILNASYAGYEAAKTILALGCDLIILENDEAVIQQLSNDKTLTHLAQLYKRNFKVIKASFVELETQIAKANIFINTNGVPGSLTPTRVTQKMINTMHKGSVYVNLASDQGLASETEHKISSLKKLTFVVNGVIHFNMQNIPALFPHSISITISNLASNLFINNNYTNPMDYIKANPKLLHAVITYQQTLTNQIVAEALHLKYKSIDSLLK